MMGEIWGFGHGEKNALQKKLSANFGKKVSA